MKLYPIDNYLNITASTDPQFSANIYIAVGQAQFRQNGAPLGAQLGYYLTYSGTNLDLLRKCHKTCAFIYKYIIENQEIFVDNMQGRLRPAAVVQSLKERDPYRFVNADNLYYGAIVFDAHI